MGLPKPTNSDSLVNTITTELMKFDDTNKNLSFSLRIKSEKKKMLPVYWLFSLLF